jgi:ribose-phosphate pyrophosphokinase
MVRNLVLLSGSSHPSFAAKIGDALGIPPAERILTHFSSGETRCEIRDSVRGKDVYIVQSFGVGPSGGGGGSGEGGAKRQTVNDYFIELCIMISACKTGGAKRVTAVLPLFPYSRQPDLPFSRIGAPHESLGGSSTNNSVSLSAPPPAGSSSSAQTPKGETGVVMLMDEGFGLDNFVAPGRGGVSYTTHDYENPALMMTLQQKTRSGHKHLTAQAGPLVADLLTCAGADRVLTCDLHEPAYQGFFDIPGEWLIWILTFVYLPISRLGTAVAAAPLL